MTTMSLCGLFLLDTAKRVDHEFQVPVRSSRHTERDAHSDILKMACHLVEEKVARDRERESGDFVNPFNKGAEKIASGYIDNYLKRTEIDNIEHTQDSDSNQRGELDSIYELQ